LIDFYKDRTVQYFSKFRFSFKKSNEYANFKEFTDDINKQAYQIYFKKISRDFIDNLVDGGKLYLFQIYNKDFAPGATGNPNLHTLYWKNLFSEENLQDVVLKLNGQAELFYREVGITKPVVHRTGEKMVNRTTKDGIPLPESVHDELFKYENNKSSGQTGFEEQYRYTYYRT
jgi:CRISPR-associated protein Cpf1